MPKYREKDNEAIELPPEGDHVFCVEDFEGGIMTKGKTMGSPFWRLKLLIETNGSHCKTLLIDHESCRRKISNFIKCTGVRIPDEGDFEFDQQAALASDVEFVDLIGLRGWLCIRHEDYAPPGREPRKQAEVSVFYTDKPKLPRKVTQPAQPQEAPAPDPLADPLADEAF